MFFTTKLKITTNVLEDFILALNELTAKITKTSETFAIKEQRKTIMLELSIIFSALFIMFFDRENFPHTFFSNKSILNSPL